MSVIEDGFAVKQQLFSLDEIKKIESVIKRIHNINDDDETANHPCPDAVRKHPELLKWVTHSKLLAFIKSEIAMPDEQIKFLQHVDAHANYYVASSGWHRDSACREVNCSGEDWQEDNSPYRLVRAAIYTRSNTLKVKKHSHKSPGTRHPVLKIETVPGDVVIFDPRLYHMGSKYHPKYSLFIAYGLDNEHSHRHRDYYLHKRKDLGYQQLTEDIKQKLGGLYLP